MSEGWIVLGVFVGGSMGLASGLVTAYATQRWTRLATLASERRQVRVNERRQAVTPVTSFLDIAARASARRFVETSQRRLYDDNVGGLRDAIPQERFEDFISRHVADEPSAIDVSQAHMVASAAAPTREIMLQLIIVWAWVGEKAEGSTERLRQAIQRARGLVEDYIVGAIEDSTKQADGQQSSHVAGEKETTA